MGYRVEAEDLGHKVHALIELFRRRSVARSWFAHSRRQRRRGRRGAWVETEPAGRLSGPTPLTPLARDAVVRGRWRVLTGGGDR